MSVIIQFPSGRQIQPSVSVGDEIAARAHSASPLAQKRSRAVRFAWWLAYVAFSFVQFVTSVAGVFLFVFAPFYFVWRLLVGFPMEFGEAWWIENLIKFGSGALFILLAILIKGSLLDFLPFCEAQYTRQYD